MPDTNRVTGTPVRMNGIHLLMNSASSLMVRKHERHEPRDDDQPRGEEAPAPRRAPPILGMEDRDAELVVGHRWRRGSTLICLAD